MECKALNRDVTPTECARAQKELPQKFCDGCSWKTAKAETSYVPYKYVIRLGDKLRNRLILEAEKENVRPARYIVKILADKLDNI